jgi:KipI family sensor histidine kinase inhibitor
MDEATNAVVLAIAERLTALRLSGVRDVVPAYASLAVHVDPRRLDLSACATTVRHVADEVMSRGEKQARTTDVVHVPVCYDPELGLDLEAVALWARCTPADVSRWHAAREYRVFMLGFLPGFAYLGPVDSRLAMPRHSTPRARVPAGSVAIAGSQTGVYPRESPGGWQIIGRTPLVLFDPARQPPTLLHGGCRVRFDAIGRDEFNRLAAASAGGAA